MYFVYVRMNCCIHRLQVKASGPTGPGSRFIKHTAMEKLIRYVQYGLHVMSCDRMVYYSVSDDG